MKLSVIVPCYNESSAVLETARRLDEALAPGSFPTRTRWCSSMTGAATTPLRTSARPPRAVRTCGC
ncbi:MAG: hypothetical protein U1G05_08630 [Kiritimatiellia bacterium]